MNEKEESTAIVGLAKRRKPWWKRMLKWLCVIVCVVIVLFIGVCSLVVWILTPGSLTPMAEKYASEYLDADVSIGRVELTFWHTFPKMTLDVDSLCVVSRSLRSLPDSLRASLPADADSLLFVRSFHGGMNVAALGIGELSLYDVAINGLQVNAVQVNDSVANYNVFPQTGGDDTSSSLSSSDVPMTRVIVDRFRLSDSGPIRFRSMSDSLDVAVGLHEVAVAGQDQPIYRLGIGGVLDTGLLREFNFDELAFGVQGSVKWDMSEPMVIGLDGFKVSLDCYTVTVDTSLDLTGDPVVEVFKAETGDIPVAEAMSHLPARFRHFLEPLRTLMTARAEVSLSRPWSLADSILPAVEGSITVPECAVVYQGRSLRRVAAEFRVKFDGADLDASVLTVRRLLIDGESIDIDLQGDITDVTSDPLVRGRFKGSVDIGKLPPRLKELMPVGMTGILDGNAEFRFRKSDLSRDRFHRLYAKGELNLRDFDAGKPDTFRVYMRHAVFEFGSNTAFVNDTQQKIDSLLTLSLKIDTISACGGGTDLSLRDLRAGAGSVNRSRSSDTTEINPFGMKLAIGRLSFNSIEDTVRLRMRNASVGGSLRRYNHEARLPQLDLRFGLGSLYFGQALNKIAMRDADVALNMYMRPRRRPAHTSAEDSIRRAIRRQNPPAGDIGQQDGNLDLRLDSVWSRMLRRWNFSGHVSAKSGRMVTPYFPLRNRLENIDLKFNQDSVQLHGLRYKAGQSDFVVDGTVSNLRRALTARRGNTIGVELTLKSDTININELVRALLAGGSIAQSADSAMVWNDDDQADEQFSQMADTASTGPLVVPRNVDARLAMRAQNVLYSDMELHSFMGDLLVYDGAVNLRNLSASTELGSVRFDGLYSAPDTADMQFGLGMKVSNFRLDRLTSLVPAIDSLMPAMRNLAGTVNADIAVTTDVSPQMDIEIPSLRAAIKIEGDSLVLIDADTFKSLSKWLMFRNKERNVIDHMAVEAVVENSAIELYPFMFDIDRYRLGVMGNNDLAMNLNYHISVLKSPIPFKFGINIKGTPDDMKIRLGGAKFKENMVVERQEIADNTRVNIVQQIESVFRRGISKARMGRLSFTPDKDEATKENKRLLDDAVSEHISHEDSILFIRQGLIENPDTLRFPLGGDGMLPAEGKQ